MTPSPSLRSKAATAAAMIARRRRGRRHAARQRQQRGLIGLGGLAVGLGVALAVLIGVGGVAAFTGLYTFYARDLPPPVEIARVREQFETTLIYDRTGQHVLYQVLDPAGDRQTVPLSEIPPVLIQATVASEDRSFFTNPGFDLRGIVRAIVTVLSGGQVQGGSTITQQLVKNTLIAPEERATLTQERKIKEIILAAEISRLYSKEQILEWYLNTNFYGNLAYGVGTAARVYFGKRVQDLSLGEAAMLAAIPQNPALNPIDAPLESRLRQTVVLNSMVAAGYISQAEATAAASEPILVQPSAEAYGILAPHFSIYARAQAERLLTAAGYDGPRLVLGGGLRIYTTLDLDLFYQTECAMRAHVERVAGGNPAAAPNTGSGGPCAAAAYLPVPPKLMLGVQRPVTNAAAVVIRPETGEILTMVGSLDYYNSGIQGNFNVAAQGLRQPGSAFKPFVYVSAFAAPNSDYTAAKMLLDVPTTFPQPGGPYIPRNEDGQFHGPVSLREALANSYNVPAVRTLNDITVGAVLQRARRLGLNTLTKPFDQYGLAFALGSAEVTLLDLTYAYTPFATLGSMTGTPVTFARPGFRALDPVSILRIEDREGRILWQFDEKQPTFARQNVLQDALAYLITDILADNDARLPAFGAGNALELSRPAAVKTGTTNDNRDAWTVGYTPQLVVGVWVGNNDNRSMGDDMTGATAAAPIWHAVMEYAHARDDLPVQTWPRPANIVEATVCQRSGLLPTPDCPKVKEIFYQEGGVSTVPTRQDIYWRRYQINSRNGLRATADTPPELITERVYFDYPPEAMAWARQTGQPLPPTEYDSRRANVAVAAGQITAPEGLARVRGTIPIRAIFTREVTRYTLEYGAGINPSQWFSLGGGTVAQAGEGLLGEWNTAGLEGLYTLRLGLILADQTFQTHIVQVAVDNAPPAIQLTSPAPAALIAASTGVVTLEATATDNVEIAYVEFFWNGEPLARVETAPYATTWQITRTGSQLFHAVAYDRAGNTARSETVEVMVGE